MEEVGRIVPRALKAHAKRDNAPLFAVLVGIWPRVAGRAIAQQAKPVGFSGGTLVLDARNPCWAAQLQGLSKEICGALNAALGQPLVKRLRVRAGRNWLAGCCESASASAARTQKKTDSWTEIATSAEGPLAGLDAGTREILSRSLAKYFARDSKGVN